MTTIIDEQAARQANEAPSFSTYQEGSETAAYTEEVQRITSLADQRKTQIPATFWPELDQLVSRYTTILASSINDWNRQTARIPSAMITGPANYPVVQMQKRAASRQTQWENHRQQLERIEAAISSCGHAISSTRSDALELLTDKLRKLEAKQEQMKQDNAAARASGQDAPYPSCTLTNNNANIRRIRTRIESIKQTQTLGTQTRSGCFDTRDNYTLTQDGETQYLYFVFTNKPMLISIRGSYRRGCHKRSK